MDLTKTFRAGIVTLVQWTMMPDAATYLYVWCQRWEIITDSQMPVEGFRSTERWQLLGVVNDEVRVLIPGCQVKAWCASEKPPQTKQCFAIE